MEGIMTNTKVQPRNDLGQFTKQAQLENIEKSKKSPKLEKKEAPIVRQVFTATLFVSMAVSVAYFNVKTVQEYGIPLAKQYVAQHNSYVVQQGVEDKWLEYFSCTGQECKEKVLSIAAVSKEVKKK